MGSGSRKVLRLRRWGLWGRRRLEVLGLGLWLGLGPQLLLGLGLRLC